MGSHLHQKHLLPGKHEMLSYLPSSHEPKMRMTISVAPPVFVSPLSNLVGLDQPRLDELSLNVSLPALAQPRDDYSPKDNASTIAQEDLAIPRYPTPGA